MGNLSFFSSTQNGFLDRNISFKITLLCMAGMFLLLLSGSPGAIAQASDDSSVERGKTLRKVNEKVPYGSPEFMARSYLSEQNNRFGMKRSLRDLEVEYVNESPAGHHVKFKQKDGSLPVFNGDIKVHINDKNEVFLVNNNYIKDIEVPKTKGVSKSSALNEAKSDFRETYKIPGKQGNEIIPDLEDVKVERDSSREPTLGIYRDNGEDHLVFRIYVTAQPHGLAKYFVSARDGSVVHKENLVKSVDGQGQVFDPNPVVALGDDTLEDDSAPAEFDGAYTTKTLESISTSGETFFLTGPHATLNDIRNPDDTPPVEPTADTFIYPTRRQDDNFEHVMAYFHIDRNQRYIQSLGFNGINNRSIEIDAHGTPDDNSFYSPDGNGTGYIAFGDGGVDDAEDAEIILHEYGHAIQDNQNPGGFGPSNQAGAIGEGFGDYWAASNSPEFDQPCVGDWDATTYDGGDSICLRRVDGTKKYPDDIVGQVHRDGEIWSGALWDIRTGRLLESPDEEGLSKDVTDKLVLQSHYLMPDDPSFKEGALAMLDADAQLFDGEHIGFLCKVFRDRGILKGCVDIGFVIDDTGSMVDEIQAVRRGLLGFINFFEAFNPAGEPNPLMELTSFKDVVESDTRSRDFSVMKTAVNNLSAASGGDCPEVSLDAIYQQASRMRDGGSILFATDASNNFTAGNRSISEVLSLLLTKKIRVHTMLTGTCSGSFKLGKNKRTSNQGTTVSADSNKSADTSTAVSSYSIISTGSGGTLNSIPEVKESGNEEADTHLQNMMVNPMKGGITPSIISVSPRTVPRGATVALEVRGQRTNFTDGSSVSFEGTGLTPLSIAVKSPTRLIARVAVDDDADTTFRSISVVSSLSKRAKETASGTGVLKVSKSTSTPTITGMSPTSGTQGSTIDVTITGVNTAFGDTSTVDFIRNFSSADSITVNSTDAVSTTEMEASITIENGAPLEYYDVEVTSGDEIVTNEDLFLVEAGEEVTKIPKISSLSPSFGMRGETITVDVNGSNTAWASASSVSASFGPSVTPVSTAVESETNASVTIHIDTEASLGFRDVTLSTVTSSKRSGDISKSASSLDSFKVANNTPSAEFSFTPSDPSAGDTVTFSDESEDTDGTITSRVWEFGDGDTSTATNPTHKYSSDEKAKTATLTVTDDNGASDDASEEVIAATTTEEQGPDFGSGTCLIEKAVTQEELLQGLRSVRNNSLQTSLGRWVTEKYYQVGGYFMDE